MIGLLAAAAPASAAVDLLTQADSRLDGAMPFAFAGGAVDSGDVNGDGRDDLIVAAPNDSTNGSAAGSVYVLFGPVPSGALDLASPSTRGFRIDGGPLDQAGSSAANAGDVNGDGLDDVVVGVPGSNFSTYHAVDTVYVVFGKKGTSRVDLNRLSPTQGFAIHGFGGISTGKAVDGAGDVNGDGLADVMVGVPGAYPGGEAFVVFGKRSGSTVDLAALGAGGFEIKGPPGAGSDFGLSVAGLRDLNGDGLADVAAGAPFAGIGLVAVVFGKRTSDPVDINALGDAGFLIEGERGEQSEAGWSVAGAGDTNGDGRPDLLIGAPRKITAAVTSAGAGYVVFGKADTLPVDLAAVAAGVGGFRLDGVLGDEVGRSASGAGDVNRDGLSDLLFGAPHASNNGRANSGSAYLVYGNRSPTSFSLGLLESLGRGRRFDGAGVNDVAGDSVGQAGDQSRPGSVDVAVGATGADPRGRQNAGAAYVVFGR